MSSFKDGLRRSVLDARAQNLYEMTKIEEELYQQSQTLNCYNVNARNYNTQEDVSYHP